jgi:hypothetical protein
LIGGAICDISPRPKSKTGIFIWHSAGIAGHDGGGFALGDRENCANAGSESRAQHAASRKRVIGT